MRNPICQDVKHNWLINPAHSQKLNKFIVNDHFKKLGMGRAVEQPYSINNQVNGRKSVKHVHLVAPDRVKKRS